MVAVGDVHSLTDFLRNHKTHMARIKATKAHEVLTVHGRAEAVILSAESYQELLDRIAHMESVAAVRAQMDTLEPSSDLREHVTEDEIERRQAAIRELMAETERVGLI